MKNKIDVCDTYKQLCSNTNRNRTKKETMIKCSSIFILLFLVSCSNNHKYTLYSKDKKQSITIISSGETRYIIDGDYDRVPEKNYVKIDLSTTPMKGFDEIVGCWKTDKYEWEIINDGVTILENNLNPKRFKFGTKFPKDKNGIPTIIDFCKSNCFDLGFEYNELLNTRGEIIVK